MSATDEVPLKSTVDIFSIFFILFAVLDFHCFTITFFSNSTCYKSVKLFLKNHDYLISKCRNSAIYYQNAIFINKFITRF